MWNKCFSFQVVKLGKASEAARELAEETSGSGATETLLGDYGTTSSGAMRTPRTPAIQDSVIQGAKDIMALTHVETPLKGGINTPLHNEEIIGDASRTPVMTPNTVLGTPFRTPQGTQIMTPSRTPGTIIDGISKGPIGTGATPLRDKLNINEEGALVPVDNQQALKVYQKSVREALETGLKSLPLPKNDFEIVVPEQENNGEIENELDKNEIIEDQSDINAR